MIAAETLRVPVCLNKDPGSGTLARHVQAAQNGCADAFASLVQEFSPRIFGYLCQMTGNVADAQDLTQETFLKAFRSLARCRELNGFPAWLFTIARRTALNHFRATKVTEPLEEDCALEDSNTPADGIAEDERTLLWALARRLKPVHFEVLWLHYHEDLPVKQIAQVMRRPGLYVRVLLHRAREQLREKITSNPAAEHFRPKGGPK